MNRRNFLLTATLAGGGTALGFSGLLKRAETFAKTGSLESLKAVGYGELFPTASKNTGETFVALPKGFEYNVFGKTGTQMQDNRPTPPDHDGMATFEMRGELRLIRNHEINHKIGKENVAVGTRNHYDESAGGGTTTLVVNPKTRELLRDFVSLSGTLNNCAGGKTPWGSWISCEETTLGQTTFTNAEGKTIGGFLKPHGYCFEVSASLNSEANPEPLKAMGRFKHEAIAVDKKSGIVYQTEDHQSAGFYRFLPKRRGRLAEGGTLQMLAIKDKANYDTRNGQKLGATFETNWVTIENPDPIEADTDENAVAKAGRLKGAAIFARLEGAFAAKDGKIYFVSTNGGDVKGGQIWRYEENGREEGRLVLLYESVDRNVLDMPDNICLNPKNNLIFLCEDSDYGPTSGGTAGNLVRILTPDGKIIDFANNIAPKFETTEFAGSTFSKDGKTLFVNIQAVGVTLAIWGDWGKIKG